MTELATFSTPEELGTALADEIATGILAAAEQGRRYVLGCPGGRSPMPVYVALAEAVRQRNLPLDSLVIALMDDYAVRTADGFATVPADAPFSVARFGQVEIVDRLAAAAPRGVPELWRADAADPQAHEDRIAAAGIDLFILASGSGDGHVAFNAPGTAADAHSRVVELPLSTRADNVRTFPVFGEAANVPEYGVTIGTGTIADYSARAVLVAHGEEKRTAVARVTDVSDYDPSWPATIVHHCRSAAIFVDRAAASAS